MEETLGGYTNYLEKTDITLADFIQKLGKLKEEIEEAIAVTQEMPEDNKEYLGKMQAMLTDCLQKLDELGKEVKETIEDFKKDKEKDLEEKQELLTKTRRVEMFLIKAEMSHSRDVFKQQLGTLENLLEEIKAGLDKDTDKETEKQEEEESI
jgi:hypothetical protein